MIICEVVAWIIVFFVFDIPKLSQFLCCFTSSCISLCLYIPIRKEEGSLHIPYGTYTILASIISVFVLLVLTGSTMILAWRNWEYSTELLTVQTICILFVGISINLFALYWKKNVAPKKAYLSAPAEEVIVIMPSNETRSSTSNLQVEEFPSEWDPYNSPTSWDPHHSPTSWDPYHSPTSSAPECQ
ncbi:hypothetical protein CAEBREN_20601 [Caenorhabditis brenneri]|uniref:Uncharacterized protein n=1 Tax=Caenorhabditis brenneri TaxID=135651 RepID=G0PAY6_CAEBE|nr:hypothetical protein CAEBREN_20601 [Caenorhabditis brenneri]